MRQTVENKMQKLASYLLEKPEWKSNDEKVLCCGIKIQLAESKSKEN